jgi:hypothetical protein
MEINVLSYGGGVNSSALFFYILENKLPLDLVIFADTGVESKETYKSVDNLKKECIKNKIEFVTVQSKHGNLYDYYFKNKLVMSIMRRDCTLRFKIAPIRQYIRKRYGKQQKFLMYIGIAYDELHRMTTSNVKYITYSYPFIDNKINRKGNEHILKKYNFIANKSGCIGCPFQSKKSWEKLCRTNIKEFERWEKLEINNRKYPKLLINNSWRLSHFKESIINQSSLLDYYDHDEKDLLCPNTHGGCFL